MMTSWMCDIRKFMDELAAKNGKPRMCFGVRVSETPEIARNIGIDLAAWIHEAELDYVVPSAFHATHFNIPVQLSWRQRYLYQHTHMPKSGMPLPIVWKKIGWHTAERYEDLQQLAGEEILDEERQAALEIIDTPTC